MTTEDKQTQEFHLREYWQVLVRRRYIVYTCVLVTTLAAAIASLIATPVYRATARLSIERTGVRLVRQSLTSSEPSWLDYQNFYNTQYQVLASNAVMKRAVENLDLPNRDVFNDKDDGEQNALLARIAEIKRSAMKAVSRAPELPIIPEGSLRPYIERLQGIVEVAPVRDSQLVDISVTHPDPAFAAEAANAICDAYKEFMLSAKLDLAQDSKKFFLERVTELRKEVAQLEKDVADYAIHHNIVLGNSKNAAQEALNDLRQGLTEATAKTAEKEAILTGKQSAPPAALPEVRQNASIQSLNDKVNVLTGQYSRQKATLGENYPSVREIKADLDAARTQLEAETLRIARHVIDSAKADLREARRNEENLATLYDRQRRRVDEQQTGLTEYETLRALAKRKRETLNDMLGRQNDMEISANLGEATHNIRLVDEALPPRIIFRPKKKLNIMLGFLFGLFLGIGAAILMEYIDNTLKTPEDVRNVLGVSVLGLVPEADSVSSGRGKRRRHSGEARSPATDPALITAKTPMSPIAESYRELRTALLLTTPGHPPRDIAVTSCQPSEGKTTTAINLATALTQLGKHVLIVDSDLRRPRCHHVLKISASRGMSNYLSGQAMIDDLYHATAIDKLSLLPAGPIPPNPAELLDSSRYLEFLRDLRGLKNFDHVIFDTPPILSVVDPLLVSRHTEGLVLVIRSAFTSREAGRLGLEKLKAGRVNLLGIVLNAVQSDHVPYQYRYYRYGYSQDSKSRQKKGQIAS